MAKASAKDGADAQCDQTPEPIVPLQSAENGLQPLRRSLVN